MDPLAEFSYPGLHDLVMRQIPAGHGRRAIDLGAGSGAFAERLLRAGWQTDALDRDPAAYRGSANFLETDLATILDEGEDGAYDLVTAIEVIEHLESPLGLLRTIRRLLTPDGVAVVTTPNVDSLPARVKFLMTGRWRAMDRHGDPTHISPIFCDIFETKLLPMAGLVIDQYLLFPEQGFQAGRPLYRPFLNTLARVLHPPLVGDCHVYVLRASTGRLNDPEHLIS